jgi:uncharacterized protein (TIGR03435 family)
MDAYDVTDYQISGLPRWAQGLGCDHFDVEATSEKVPTVAQLQQMMQGLLADRFALQLHWEPRQLPVYALVIAKTGHKVRKLRADEQVPTFATLPPPSPTVVGSISGLVRLISDKVDRRVINETGLTGNYEYPSLDWEQFRRDLRGPADDNGATSIFAALQQDLGLKLEPRKDRVEMLCIDHAEKPAEN